MWLCMLDEVTLFPHTHEFQKVRWLATIVIKWYFSHIYQSKSINFCWLSILPVLKTSFGEKFQTYHFAPKPSQHEDGLLLSSCLHQRLLNLQYPSRWQRNGLPATYLQFFESSKPAHTLTGKHLHKRLQKKIEKDLSFQARVMFYLNFYHLFENYL